MAAHLNTKNVAVALPIVAVVFVVVASVGWIATARGAHHMIRKPSRLRRRLKWVGLVGGSILFVLFVVGLRWSIYCGTTRWGVGLYRGTLAVLVESTPPVRIVSWQFKPHGGRRLWWPPILARGDFVLIPTWLPLTIVLAPTAILWYRDRRPPPGRCQQCGYDLTGNTSGVCPECGASG